MLDLVVILLTIVIMFILVGLVLGLDRIFDWL